MKKFYYFISLFLYYMSLTLTFSALFLTMYLFTLHLPFLKIPESIKVIWFLILLAFIARMLLKALTRISFIYAVLPVFYYLALMMAPTINAPKLNLGATLAGVLILIDIIFSYRQFDHVCFK